MRNPLANIAASPKENLMVRPVAANVVRISVDQMPLLLRRLEGVLAKERLYAQSPHVRSQEMSGPSSDAARGPSLTQLRSQSTSHVAERSRFQPLSKHSIEPI
jgi:hypothetical protein